MVENGPPDGLGAAGADLWAQIASDLDGRDLDLDARERRWLLDACAEADVVALLSAGLSGAPLMVRGSQGQDVINPLICEIRQHREALARLLARLKLDDAAEAGQQHRYTSSTARDAAYKRWRDRGTA